MSQDQDVGAPEPVASEPADDELTPRLGVIEQQPLPERAAAYAALHDELARQLESGPTG